MTSGLATEATPIAGSFVVRRDRIGDDRGWFERTFCSSDLQELLSGRAVVQSNRSFTAMAGTVRGIHLQLPPHAECKLVTCVSGAVYDVVVDLRAGSPTFLQWFGVELSPESRNALWIPEGCGHAFQTLRSDCELWYMHTAAYAPDSEFGIDALDPRIAISWPTTVTMRSPRDEQLPKVATSFDGVSI